MCKMEETTAETLSRPDGAREETHHDLSQTEIWRRFDVGESEGDAN